VKGVLVIHSDMFEGVWMRLLNERLIEGDEMDKPSIMVPE